MKRYRVLGMSFDTRASILSLKPEDICDERAKAILIQNKNTMQRDLINQYGLDSFDEKRINFCDMGIMPFSILAFHNNFLIDCRNAFVIGAYYPTLTGVCALGERILNHLILLLREDYKHNVQYKKVSVKKSFDNWNIALDILSSWNVLLKNTTEDFKKLLDIRNKSIHFNPETDTNDRLLALGALQLLQTIIGNQFSAFGIQPWFIENIPGETYIKKDWENNPFIKKVYLPNCILVGSKHKLDMVQGKWITSDDTNYCDDEISDDDYRLLRLQKNEQ